MNQILIVDDNKENLHVLSKFLVTNNFRVRVSSSGVKALLSIQREKPDLILLDIMLPDINGFEVCQKVKSDRNYKNIPIIFISAKHSIEDRIKAFEIGAVDYITKPFYQQEVLARIHNHIKLFQLQNRYKEQLNEEIKKYKKQQTIITQQSKLASLGKMIDNIAHQWRQPLSQISSILINMKISKSNNKLTDKFFENSISDMHNILSYMSNTVDDFRDYIKTEEDSLEFSIDDVLKQSITLMLPSLKEKNIEITYPQEISLKTYGNPNDLIQILITLLSNSKNILEERAIENPQIVIEIKEIEGVIEITVEDNGKGVHEQNLPLIFNENFSTRKDHGGTGLGLFLVKKILKDSFNSSIEVKNSIKGACFSFFLKKYN